MIDIIGIHKQAAVSKAVRSVVTVRREVNDVSGFTRFYIGVNIKADDFADWSPQRITNFFNGIAEVVRARGGVAYGPCGEQP